MSINKFWMSEQQQPVHINLFNEDWENTARYRCEKLWTYELMRTLLMQKMLKAWTVRKKTNSKSSWKVNDMDCENWTTWKGGLLLLDQWHFKYTITPCVSYLVMKGFVFEIPRFWVLIQSSKKLQHLRITYKYFCSRRDTIRKHHKKQSPKLHTGTEELFLIHKII